MMRNIKIIALSLAILSLSACTTPVIEHFYRLNYPVAALSTAEPKYELLIASVKLPDAVNRPQLVIQKSATESLVSDEQRWVAPLDEQITQALIAHLRTQLPEAWMSSEASAGTVASANLPRYHLKIQIDQLLIQSGDQLTLEATWLLQDGSRKLLKRDRNVFTIRLNGQGYEAVAPAVSEAVLQLSSQLVKTVQSNSKLATGSN
ncbi:PqiC family protein [Undibacterium sp. TJN19]|uniref:PqiC family protein n=1 Tax=Undibacterium sp. TJN19 TaxID=3413055 RepID=UPI003BEFE7C2